MDVVRFVVGAALATILTGLGLYVYFLLAVVK